MLSSGSLQLYTYVYICVCMYHLKLSCLRFKYTYTHLHPGQRLELIFSLSIIGLNLPGVSFVKCQMVAFCMKTTINTHGGVGQHLLNK